MNNNFIFSKKNTSDMGNKQIERNLENISFQQQEKNSANTNNNIHFLDRPNYNNYERNNSKINNFYNYTIPQKASLGYNVLFEKQQENLSNKNINNENKIENNIENNVDLFKFNNLLPNNIYHNFSEHTRYTKKKNSSTNYNINDRNNEEKICSDSIKGPKTLSTSPFYSYSSTR